MRQNYKKEFDRWLLETSIMSNFGAEFTASITVKDQSNSPDASGINNIENFIDSFSDYWHLIFNKLSEYNSEISKKDIENSISPKIYLYAPALVDSITYDLMVLFELTSDNVQHQNCMFCFNGGNLVFSEQHV